jgi:hypothetical protein
LKALPPASSVEPTLRPVRDLKAVLGERFEVFVTPPANDAPN